MLSCRSCTAAYGERPVRGSTSPTGAAVTFAPSATDTGDATPTVTTDHASGSTFAIGETIVTVTATDASGNKTEKTFKITVNPIAATLAIKAAGPFEMGSSPVQLEWTSLSDGAVTFAGGTEGVCSVSAAGVLTLLGTGECSVSATQAAAGEFLAATAVPVSFQITPVPVQASLSGSVVNGTEGVPYPLTTHIQYQPMSAHSREASHTLHCDCYELSKYPLQQKEPSMPMQLSVHREG